MSIEPDRNLAVVREVEEVLPHFNADTLEIARVLGWYVVIRKGEFKPGDYCVYVSLDTQLPEREEFEFLRSKKFKVKTIKLRGRISQGILFPLSILPSMGGVELGADVTEVIGARKIEKPVPRDLQALGAFPTHLIQKTDEERIQNLPMVLRDLIEFRPMVSVTVKHDGTSATYLRTEEGLRICSRNLELEPEAENPYTYVAEKYRLRDKMKPGDMMQGEIVGPGIQKNPEGLSEVSFRMFNLFIQGHPDVPASPQELAEFADEKEIPTVDPWYDGRFEWKTLEELLDEADKTVYGNGKQAEGLVVRPMSPEFCVYQNKPLSFKVVSNKYLLKHEHYVDKREEENVDQIYEEVRRRWEEKL